MQDKKKQCGSKFKIANNELKMKIHCNNNVSTFQGNEAVTQEDCDGGHFCQEAGQCISKYLYHKFSNII